MSKFLLLIWDPETGREASSQEDVDMMFKAYGEFTQDIVQRGLMVSGEATQPSNTSATVRVQDGQRIVEDGPFAQGSHQISGFYLIDARDRDQALEVAAAIPSAAFGHGTIEVRPVWEFEATGASN
jgi:hypothetical protein